MTLHWTKLPPDTLALLRQGTVIPAHPLALDAARRLDARRQRALTRYYLDAGSGGLAVGVHATQFAIRERGLYEPVLKLAAETAQAWARRPLAMIAGLSGKTAQAKQEAGIARARRLTGAKHLVAVHVPPAEVAAVKAHLAALDPAVILFERAGESRKLAFGR